MEKQMKVSRKKFFISLSAVLITSAAVFSNPVNIFRNRKSSAVKLSVKESPFSVKRNSTGALHG